MPGCPRPAAVAPGAGARGWAVTRVSTQVVLSEPYRILLPRLVVLGRRRVASAEQVLLCHRTDKAATGLDGLFSFRVACRLSPLQPPWRWRGVETAPAGNGRGSHPALPAACHPTGSRRLVATPPSLDPTGAAVTGASAVGQKERRQAAAVQLAPAPAALRWQQTSLGGAAGDANEGVKRQREHALRLPSASPLPLFLGTGYVGATRRAVYVAEPHALCETGGRRN